MESDIVVALITAGGMILVNILSNVVLNHRQTALLEYRLKQLEDSLLEIKGLPERVTVLETKQKAVEDAIKELRLS